jgi:hypothetical protein
VSGQWPAYVWSMLSADALIRLSKGTIHRCMHSRLRRHLETSTSSDDWTTRRSPGSASLDVGGAVLAPSTELEGRGVRRARRRGERSSRVDRLEHSPRGGIPSRWERGGVETRRFTKVRPYSLAPDSIDACTLRRTLFK